MAELPEIVLRRLSQMAAGANHPDAGQLTAFTEGTLTKNHRDVVLDHLVTCSQCNRLVALIAPASEIERVVSPRAVPRGWLAWTPLRWVAVAAAIAVAASAVLIGRIGHQAPVLPSPSATVGQDRSAATTAQLSAQLTVQPSPPRSTKGTSPATRKSLRPTATVAAPPEPVLGLVNPALAGQGRPAVPGDVRDQMAFETSMFSNGDSWFEPPPASVQTPPEPPPVVSGNVSVPPTLPTGSMWVISDGGVLQESNDSGHTWAPVAVPTRLPLRALSALGQNIWVGGDQGVLYHSSDAGQTWTPVVPASNGVALSADIVRILFSDLRHGWIATRDGGIWTTRDYGATWSPK